MDAKALVAEIHKELQDPDGVRWPATDVVEYLNDGQRFIVGKSPSATASEVELTLAAGPQQEIPSGARMLLDVLRNATGKQRMVTQVPRRSLDASSPGWAGGRQRSVIVHFMTDARTPRLFDVYPPAVAGTKVVAMLCMEPVDLPVPGGPTADTVTGSLTLLIEYREALYHFALYRAFSKDAEYGGNADLAKAHFDLCGDALGINTGHPSTAQDMST